MPVISRFKWYLDPLSPHQLKNPLSELNLLQQNFLDPRMVKGTAYNIAYYFVLFIYCTLKLIIFTFRFKTHIQHQNNMNLKALTVISSYVYFLCLCISPMNAYGTSEIKKGYQNLNELRHSDAQHDISSLREPHHRHKRGFRSSVAERIAHGFGKRTISVYTGVNRLADLLSTGYREDEVPQTKIG